MKLTKLAVVVLFATACLTTLASEVLAAEAGQASKVVSNGVVNFQQGSTTDPEGNSGPLRIEAVSSLSFGTVNIKGDTATYPAVYTVNEKEEHLDAGGAVTATDYLPLNITTVDDRGTNTGWQLQVTQSRQFSELASDGTLKADGSVLNGASLKMSVTDSVRPTAKKTEPILSVPTTLASDVVVNNKFQTLVTANDGEGLGTWNSRLGSTVTNVADAQNEQVELTIPGGTKIEKASYEAELTWLLIDSPDIAPVK